MSTPDDRENIVDHIRDMRAFALSLARDASLADDLVQDSLVKAWSNFDKFKPGTNLRAWLITILRNTYYSNMRRKMRETRAKQSARPILFEKPAHDGHLQLAELRQAFEALSEEHREALMLVGVLGFSYEEASEALDVAIGTVKSRANRARQKLIEALGYDTADITDATTLAVVSGLGDRIYK